MDVELYFILATGGAVSIFFYVTIKLCRVLGRSLKKCFNYVFRQDSDYCPA